MSMSEEWKDSKKWVKGMKSPNSQGRPKTASGKGKPISRLRSTLNKLKEIEPESIEVIQKAVLGEEVDKVQLDTSKWVISSITTITRAAIAEEQYKSELDRLNRVESIPEVKATGTEDVKPVSRFSLRIVEDEE